MHYIRGRLEPINVISRGYYSSGIFTTGLGIFSLIDVPRSALLSLPREIRDEIFAHLLRAGDLAILRTSLRIYKECRERLYREGIFRFKMGFPDGYRGACLPNQWIYFQNLHLHIFVGHSDREEIPVSTRMQLDGLRLLDETYPEVIYPKQECRITFDFGAVDPGPKRPLHTCKMRVVLLMLAPLVVFTTVVFMFVPGQSELWEIEGTLQGKWEILKGTLERKLGPSKFICGTDEEEGRLVFHPLEWSNSLARMQEIAES